VSITSLQVPTANGNVTLEVSPLKPLFILGRNGTGKSALVHRFAGQLAGSAIYLPGARPSYFDDESSSLTPASRRHLTQNLRAWDGQADTRWHPQAGTLRNVKAIHDLTATEVQFKIDAANEIQKDGKDSSAIALLQSGMSPLERVNAILRQSNLAITLVIESAEIKAVRDNNVFSLAKTSDGERIAIILVSEVVAAPTGSVFLIDEPELHLHRAIIVPLITSIIHENPDSTFIISTHELDLVSACPNASIAVIRNCFWPSPNSCHWEVDQVVEAGRIPEDIRIDILGSRRKILFVEGTPSSLDEPLYALLFPNVSVRSRESCREVERAVTGLLATQDIHHAEAFGMVDSDGMSQDQIAVFEAKSIYPLPVHSVESLYYAEEVLHAIAGRQAETFGIDRDTLLDEARMKAMAALNSEQTIEHLASRVAERQFRETVLQQIPRREDLVAANALSISITVPSTYQTEFARLKLLRDNNDIAAVVSRYPVRESGLLSALATGLRFSNRNDYEKAVLRRTSVDNELCDKLRRKVGALALKLG
jgi:ABC-type cobalamin/Fe3+-siderophores transport system ATPase subunit